MEQVVTSSHHHTGSLSVSNSKFKLRPMTPETHKYINLNVRIIPDGIFLYFFLEIRDCYNEVLQQTYVL